MTILKMEQYTWVFQSTGAITVDGIQRLTKFQCQTCKNCIFGCKGPNLNY